MTSQNASVAAFSQDYTSETDFMGAHYTVNIYDAVTGEFLFTSEVFSKKSHANQLINHMTNNTTELVYSVYKSKPQMSTRRHYFVGDGGYYDSTEYENIDENQSQSSHIRFTSPEYTEFTDADTYADTYDPLINDPLSGMIIERYGRGYLLLPQPDDSRRGEKYFYNAWWREDLDGWFFRPRYLEEMYDLGAEPQFEYSGGKDLGTPEPELEPTTINNLTYDSEDSQLDDDYVPEEVDAEYEEEEEIDLTGMTFSRYGKGYLLTPPDESEYYGLKYFLQGWWMKGKNGWFFKEEFYNDLHDMGAVEFIPKKSKKNKKHKKRIKSESFCNDADNVSDDENLLPKMKSRSTDNDLSSMTLTNYGKGYLLTPKSKDKRVGEKYFHNGWWREDLNGWFFRKMYFEDLVTMGARYVNKATSSKTKRK